MLVLTALSLFCLFFATYLISSQQYVYDAFLLLVLAGIGLGVSFLRPGTPRQSTDFRLRRLLPRTRTGWTRVIALAVALWVTGSARKSAPTDDFAGLLLWWLLAVAAFAVTCVVPLVRRRRAAALFSRETYALAALLVIAFLVRGVALGRVPANLSGDEGTQLAFGYRLLQPPLGNPFATGWYSVPTMSFFAYGAAMRLFGATIAGGRALSAITGTLTVLTTFLLGRALGGRRVGWIAALVLTFSHYHIHFSRLASNQIADPFIGTLALWLLWLVLLPNRRSDAKNAALWGLCGVVTGAGWYAYFGARWVSPLVGLFVLWRMAAEPRFLARHWRGVLVFASGWLVVVLPLLGWYTVHPSPLTERYNAVSIFASGWLEREIATTGTSMGRLLLQQFWKSATAFHLTNDPTFWYFPETPLADFVTGALLLVGMAAAVARVRRPSRSMVLVWFWMTLVMAWGLTENPPSSQRGLLLMPAVALLVAWGVEALWRRCARYTQLVFVVSALLAGMVIVLNLGFYFGVYAPKRLYGNPTAEIGTVFAQYMLEHPHPACGNVAPEACRDFVYFFGPPRLYWGFGSIVFLLRDQAGVDVQPGEIPRDAAPLARFAFVNERRGELEAVQSAYPGGVVTEVKSFDGRVLMTLYDWTAEGAP